MSLLCDTFAMGRDEEAFPANFWLFLVSFSEGFEEAAFLASRSAEALMLKGTS